MKQIIHIFLLSLLLISLNAYSNDTPVEFNNDNDKQRYEELIEEIRCLVCQNQSLSDSNAELAQDLRKEVYEMIISGKDNDEITQFLVERYGDFVLYRPPLKSNTWLLWFGPFLFLIIGTIFAIVIIRKQSGSDNTTTEIDEEQKKRLTELLDETDDGDTK